MEILKTLDAYRSWRRNGVGSRTLGFVPTMGALHSGHLKLVAASTKANDLTVVSIFVNPLQFGPSEDFTRYPRPFEKDRQLCQSAGVAAIFAPEPQDFYASDHATYVDVIGLDRHLCGASRPGHFRGVCTVVLKLFNIISPTRAYFGQKDIQQALILRKMAGDLSLEIALEIIPTEREPSGLALSSRNVFLSSDEKARATSLSRSLALAHLAWKGGETSAEAIKEIIRKEISASSPTRIDYIEAVSEHRLEPIESLNQPAVLAVAVFFGKTRLIDNILLS